jgi:hypothetical protein
MHLHVVSNLRKQSKRAGNIDPLAECLPQKQFEFSIDLTRLWGSGLRSHKGRGALTRFFLHPSAHFE